jgi:GDPmannose 4,6-dehydratase
MQKKILITGVTGQDGSYMADLCLSKNCIVYGMTRRSSNINKTNFKHNLHNPNFHLVYGDLSDLSSIENLVKDIQPDYFINFAAQSFVGASWIMPEQTFDVTALGVLRCLEAIRKFTPKCKFYSAGSSEEMGDVDYSPQDLKHPIKPRSPYGAAKASARHIVKVYRESYNLFAIHCILYNHESERRGEEFVTRKITKNIARIKNAIDCGKEFDPLELGNIDSKRDWSHAQDFVEAVWEMLNQEQPKEFILSSGETHSIREFVEKAFKIAGIKGHWSFLSTIGEESSPENEVFIKDTGEILMRINPKFYRPAEVDILLGDSNNARKELNWLPKNTFDMLVQKMVDCDLKLVNEI